MESIPLRGLSRSADRLRAALGPDGLGAVEITGVPGLAALRDRMLRLAREFGELPTEAQSRYERPDLGYSVGWSHAKERLRGGVPDAAKGSFYADPRDAGAGAVRWPDAEVPGFGRAFVDLGLAMRQVGLEVLQACMGPDARVTRLVRDGGACSCRMLHYFPREGRAPPAASDDHCGWHLDHGAFTVLTLPMYFDADGREVPAPADAGLMLMDRHGRVVRARLADPGGVLCQVGETTQVLTGGRVRATPHAVQSSASRPRTTREQFACFLGPDGGASLALPADARPDALETPFLPPGVPRLRDRHEAAGHAPTYAAFERITRASYH